MPTHDDAIDLATMALDFPISDAERAGLEAHLAGCPACRLEVAAIRRDALRLQSLEPIAPPAWVARAIGRKRRSIATLLIAAALVVGGTVGAATIVGGVLDRMTAVLPTHGPSLDQASPAISFSSLPRTIGWSPGRDMGAPRVMHTATRLADGTVLIAGGKNAKGTLDSAELYVPATDSFRPVAPMNLHRSGGTATLLQDGRVLVVAGLEFSAEIYDPVLDTWTLTRPMIMRRHLHAAILLADGRVLVVGGSSGAGSSSTAEIFDPATNSWILAGQMAQRRASLTATLLPDGRVLVAGGEPMPGTATAVDAVEIFDPATATFVAAQPMLDARSRHTATLLADGRVLVVSGVQGPAVITSVELYDVSSDTWTHALDVNEPRETFSLTQLPDGRVLIVGGYSQGTQTSELRDPTTGAWSMAGDTIEVRGYHTATQLLDGRVLVTGGIKWDEVTLASTELWLAEP